MASKKNKVVLTLREMIHYLNAMEEDVDIYVDGLDGCAVVGGDIALTPAGKRKFGKVLDMHLEGHTVVGTDKDYEDLDAFEEDGKGDGGRLNLAMFFIRALAGYCSCENYDKWFEGDDAVLI